MPSDSTTSPAERLWNWLDDRYSGDGGGCGCDVSSGAADALREAGLDREDVAAYRDGDVGIDHLATRVGVGAGAVDDLPELAGAVEAEGDEPARDGTTGGSSG